jgi:hypothetical protein
MKLGKGVRFICIKDINEINQSDDMLEQYKNNIINAVQKEIGRCHYKVSGFESDDIGGMPMREFYRTLAKVFIQINEKFLPMFPFYLDKPLGQLIFQTTIYRFASSSSYHQNQKIQTSYLVHLKYEDISFQIFHLFE